MKKAIKKAIADINKAIVENQIDNFAEEFDDGTNTYYFVKECLTENQLDADKMQDFSEEQQKDYIYNILVFWFEYYSNGNNCPAYAYEWLKKYIKREYGYNYLYDVVK